ncbi:glycosyltransferase family 2 protein [Mucilaginibacter pocheonensis]|uniref:Glycosyltransferase involved in cell wall biosynthesis n=1 Tax=Mucilaginibacter pocheonensis TaxID=398050 RepID=A0ABU1TD01_9SPHI|nr:glycosyltransferase [Mucilaginibacter pocheonensis]MDR6943184.1 glycosyltransferase involved in cell wall biosynthesis [Mucilaginibacter pocheonensis]
MNNIKISVVIPTYNRPILLQKCLQALAMQRLNKDQYEIIVVSDGPDSKTERLLNTWIKRRRSLNIKYFSLFTKKGPAAARNYGWLNARGHLVAFTDDDCVPDKNWLSAYLKSYRTGDKVAFTGKTTVPVPNQPTDHELNTSGLQFADFITANCCCPKGVLKMIGGFDERFTMAWREDSDLQFKLINEGVEIIKVETAQVVHPVRKAPWGVSIKDQKKTMFNALLYKKHPWLYRKKIQSRPPFQYYFMIGGAGLAFAGLVATSIPLIAVGGLIWAGFTGSFIKKRLSATAKTTRHISEMIVTSVVIPFLSIFWQLYGAVKYRVLFI